MPLVEADCLLGFHADGFFRAVPVVIPELSVLQIQGVSKRIAGQGTISQNACPGYDRAGGRGGIDPGRNRVRVVIGDSGPKVGRKLREMTGKSGNIASFNKALSVEAGGLANPAGNKTWRIRLLGRLIYGVSLPAFSLGLRLQHRNLRTYIAVKWIICDQAARRAPRKRCRLVHRPLPRALGLNQFWLQFGPFVRGGRNLVIQLFQLTLLVRCRRRYKRWGIAFLPSPSPLVGEIIEVRIKLVELFLRYGVVFVIVAAGAAD